MNPMDTATKEEFLESLFSRWSPGRQVEYVPIDEAYGRILAEDLTAKYSFPVVRASMRDGIAVKSADFAAGMPDTSAWKLGVDYIRADTGDDFDDAFDSVIMIENVDLHDDGSVLIHFDHDEKFQPGMNVQLAGSRLKEGAIVAKAMRRINGMVASGAAEGGYTKLPVIKRPRVAYVPTGSELITPYEVPKRGQNIASNSYMITELIKKYGGEPVCYPIVKDDMAALEAALDKALAECDMVLLSGGSSKGEEDFTTRLFAKRGEVLNHWVRTAPGRPMCIGIADNKPLINLSGPPIAAFNGLEWCVRRVIARFMDVPAYERQELEVTLANPLTPPPIMSILSLFYLTKDENGEYLASSIGGFGPAPGNAAVNNPMLAHAYYMSRLGGEKHEKGDKITVKLLCTVDEIV